MDLCIGDFSVAAALGRLDIAASITGRAAAKEYIVRARPYPMKLAGIELRYLAGDLAARTGGYYVSNIYGISRESILFKLHHSTKPDIMLMFSTAGLWESSVRIDAIEENKMLRRLRGELLRSKLDGIEHRGTERVAYLKFDASSGPLVLVGEFFGEGNIILCDGNMRILALLHSLSVRHRKLAPGLTYEPPPANNIDVFGVTADSLGAPGPSGLSSERWLGRTLGLPARYVGAILGGAHIDSKKDCTGLSDTEISALVESARDIARRVAGGNHEPFLVEGSAESEVHPVDLSCPGAKRVGSFAEGLDQIFTAQILESGRKAHSLATQKKIDELESALSEQERAVATVREKSDSISALAGSLLTLASDGAVSFNDARTAGVLARGGASISTEKGIQVIKTCGQKVPAHNDWSLHKVASVLYDESKRNSRAIPEIERLYRKTQKKLDALRSESDKQEKSISYSELRKKSWYERYRWFYTTDGLLAIGGRDASSNSSIIRKHLEEGDRVFHAEIFGSPFFILKGGVKAAPASLAETAHATVCFSRAWRESMYGLNAYWVEPGQIGKAAPSGQYLPRGSFTIQGRRNFVRVPVLRMAVGLAVREGGHAVCCGPPDTIRGACAYYAVIEPSGLEMTEAAKKIRSEFAKLGAQPPSIDELVRALPAGTSHIIETGTHDDKTG